MECLRLVWLQNLSMIGIQMSDNFDMRLKMKHA